nr:hypothetical protein [Propionibacterium sp.]
MNDQQWVSAAPFRAHLNHVCAGAGVHWAVVAVHAGLPLGVIGHLLDPRPDRRVQRISGRLARRLFAIDAGFLDALRTTTVAAEPSRRAARRLCSHSWSTDALAHRLHLSRAQLASLVSGNARHVPALVDLQVRALLALTEAARSDLPGRPRRAA